MINKVCFHQNLPLLWLYYLINSIATLQRKTMTLKTFLATNSMTLTKFKLYNFQTNKNRRISVISNTGKILERPMYYRIYKFFNDKKLIYPLQFGFRQKYSTAMSILALMKNIKKTQIKKTVFLVFLQTFKNHLMLLNIILYFQSLNITVCVVLQKWFKFYLSNEKQYDSINSYKSNLAVVKFVAPQGSILVPFS